MNLATKCRPGWIGYLRGLAAIVLALSVMASPLLAADKTDQVWLKNGDHITGEIKKLERGTFYFKPSYALDSIEIDWTMVDRIETMNRFNVVLTSGATYSGIIRKVTETEDPLDFIITEDGTVVRIHRFEVVTIQQQKASLWQQLNGSIDYGFSFVSGNNQTQSSLGANVAYRGEKNQVSSGVSSSFSGQSDTENTTREAFASEYSRILTKKMFATGVVSLLSSSQQELDLRTTFGGGIGRTLVRTDRTAFVTAAGIVVNKEQYTPQSGKAPLTTSTELLLSSDFSNFHFKTYSVTSGIRVFPSLSNWGRVRISSETNISWEFIKDLYWNLRVYENFDSRPPVNAPKNDFGVTTSLGWKF